LTGNLADRLTRSEVYAWCAAFGHVSHVLMLLLLGCYVFISSDYGNADFNPITRDVNETRFSSVPKKFPIPGKKLRNGIIIRKLLFKYIATNSVELTWAVSFLLVNTGGHNLVT